jgi:hypothetical protein
MEREFITLNKYPEYEITTGEPWIIRKKNTGRIMKHTLKPNNYYYVWINQQSHLLHRILAEQFIPNPENMSQCDHKNRQRTDNRLSNIRWVPMVLNQRNKTSYNNVQCEYLNELPEQFKPFTEYQPRTRQKRFFDNLYIKKTNEGFEFITHNSEHQYRRLHQNRFRGQDYVAHRDVEGKACVIYFSRISKAHAQLTQTQTTIAETQKQIAETENNLSKVLLNMTEIIKNQQTQSQHPEEETSDEEYEHFEPDEDYKK